MGGGDGAVASDYAFVMSNPTRPLLLACAAMLALPAVAGPVDGNAAPADPYELAMRWTLASLTPQQSADPVVAVAVPAPLPRFSPLPNRHTEAGVPDPGAYALMGALLLGAGLVARRFTRGQRGFSKKT